MTVHHAVGIFCFSAALYKGVGHVYVLAMLVTEITTPFVNLRWWLDKAGRKNSRVYLANGLAMLALWTVFRVAFFPIYFWYVYATWGRVHDSISAFWRLWPILMPLVFFLLNLRWFVAILRGAKKALAGKKKTIVAPLEQS